MNSSENAFPHRLVWPVLLVLSIVLAGCGSPPATQTPPTPTPTAAPGQPEQATGDPAPPAADPGEAQPAAVAFDEISPLAADEAADPAGLSIPAIDMNVNVQPMGWRVETVGDTRTTTWVLPDAAAGWHPNSARPGMAGNVIVSGHQLLGEAVFAPIALGDTQPGQDVLLTDARGRIFVYRIVEVTDPIEISTDPAVEQQTAAQYINQDDTPRLTLISGWPEFSSTHRVFVIAELQGVLR